MGKRESYAPGTFSWVELATTDSQGAKAFYAPLLDWVYVDNPVGDGMTYTMCMVEGDAVAALYQRDDGPAWLSYVTVASADATAARARELGATIVTEPFDVMEFGRMALLQDPQGATFAVWEPRAHIGASRVNDPGCLTWNHLATTDPEAAVAFYSSLFEWALEPLEREGSPPFWTIKVDGRDNGAVTAQRPDASGPPRWIAWFTVASLDQALAKVEPAGGKVVVPRSEMPAGLYAVCEDPQGAIFMLFEGEVDE